MKTTIEMAREAGLRRFGPLNIDPELERFAELVRADLYKEMNDPLVLMCKQMVADEREACAKVAEQHPAYDWAPAVCEITYAIRARGNT